MNVPVVVGIALALANVLLAQKVGFERRTLYVAVTLVSASYYSLFAVMSDELRVLASESAIAVTFALLALFGFRYNMKLVVLALVLHALLDARHSALILNSGTPAWWPSFCLAYDLTLAVVIAWQIRRPEVERTHSSLARYRPPRPLKRQG